LFCVEETVGHVLRVEYPAGSKLCSCPPSMQCVGLDSNFEALGVKLRKTYDFKNCKLKSNTNEQLGAGFVNVQERFSNLCMSCEVGIRH
jgi:hypothetical protein